MEQFSLAGGPGGVNVGPGENGGHGDAGGFDRFEAALAAVHQHEGEGDVAPLSPDFINGFESGSAGGDGVIHHHHGIASLEVALDQFAAAVDLGLLADGKTLQSGTASDDGSDADGQSNRVRPHGQAPNGDWRGAESGSLFLDHGPAHFPQPESSLGIKGGEAGVAVKVAFFAGSEGEIPVDDGFPAQ